MRFCSTVLLMFFISAATSNVIILQTETGKVSSEDGNYFTIRVPKGHQIEAEILSLTGGFLKLRGGLKEVKQVFQSKGSLIRRSPEDGSSDPELLSLPIRFQTTTRKLFIDARGVGTNHGGGFSIRYASFKTDGTCGKDLLRSEFEDEEITCDSDALAPVAGVCNATLQCRENYKQYNKMISCSDGEWKGNIECYPKRNLIEECTFDFDGTENDIECPFTVDEVANYFLEFEEATEFFEPNPGRSPFRKVNCRNICRQRRICRSARLLSDIWVKCIFCIVKHGCRRPSYHYN